MSDDHGFDALLPAQMAAKAEQVGVTKAALPLNNVFVVPRHHSLQQLHC